jgi:hypothetical protein
MNYNVSASTSTMSPVVMIIYLVILVLMIAAVWRVFSKAGRPGWAAIIPIYNVYVMIRVAGKPGWWLILYFIPIVDLIIAIMVYHGLSKAFGKGGGFTVGLIFLPFIFMPILGFGKAVYTKPAGA